MKLYNDYDSYLRKRCGSKVYRIGIDAGFSCPNRDGSKGFGGCIYCDEYGSRAPYMTPGSSVREQLTEGIKRLKGEGIHRYIAYFQAFSNTYAPVDRLKKVYDEVLPFKEVIGMSIGTRPDAVDHEKIDLIASYQPRFEVWLEYGLQSVHDKTLALLKRAHSFSDFEQALNMAKAAGIRVSAHVILGLPGETRLDMVQTARMLGSLGIDGVKIHILHILKGTLLEEMYHKGDVKVLEEGEYVDLACEFLKNLPKEVVIQRLTGQGTRQTHVAPEWALDKTGVINKIDEALRSSGACQGILAAGAIAVK